MHSGAVNTARQVGTQSFNVPTLATYKSGYTPVLYVSKPMTLETPYHTIRADRGPFILDTDDAG
jgi:hypothetical protein